MILIITMINNNIDIMIIMPLRHTRRDMGDGLDPPLNSADDLVFLPCEKCVAGCSHSTAMLHEVACINMLLSEP